MDKTKNKKKSLNELIKMLPKEIVYKIRFMTYKFQRGKMLRDIKNYVVTNTYLRNMYHLRIIIREQLNEPEDKNWLVNDFYCYLNKNVPLMHGYIQEVYDFFKRKKHLVTREKINNFICKMDHKNVSTQINTYLAMMTNYERIMFANYCLTLESY